MALVALLKGIFTFSFLMCPLINTHSLEWPVPVKKTECLWSRTHDHSEMNRHSEPLYASTRALKTKIKTPEELERSCFSSLSQA